MGSYVIGIDLGGTSAKLGIFADGGKLLKKWSIPTRKENHGEFIIPDLKESVFNELSALGISKGDVYGIGMGVPGAVREDGFLDPCVNLDQWGGFNINEAVSAAFGIPARAANDVNMAAMGEYCFGSGKGFKSMALVAIGTGIGAGIILDGRLYVGAHGAAGELGHIKVMRGEKRTCGCGGHGCAEQYAAAPGVVYLAEKLLEETGEESSLRGLSSITCKDVFDHASSGDDLALKAVGQVCDCLGLALAAFSCSCDTEAVILGGGVAQSGGILLSGVRKSFAEYAFPSSLGTKILLASLGNDAGICGAPGLTGWINSL